MMLREIKSRMDNIICRTLCKIKMWSPVLQND